MSTPVTTLQLTFDDEFNTFSNSPNGTVGWETRLPYYGTASRNLSGAGEAEYYSDSSVGVNPFSDTNGVLSITASQASVTGANALNEPYNSGAITTYTSFAQEYGYFEINAKLPTGNGFWSAFWLAPTSQDGQSELDGFEVLGNNSSQLYATTHSEVNGTFVPNLQELNVPNTSTAFHTYGVDWEPKTITWYEDGVAIATAPTPANMDEKMFLLMNLAIGAKGSWPGAPTSPSTEFPASYQIDYVHAYATANTKYVSGTAAIGIGAPEGQGSITGVVAVGTGVGTPIKGVTVSLLSSSGVVLQTTTSDGFGDYQFNYVNAGSYQVKMTSPSGYVPQPGSTGVAAVTLTAGQADLVATLKLAVSTTPVTTGSVTGTTVLASGSSSAALSGVTVTLLTSAGAVVTKTTTNSSGVYSFTGVTAGSYEVQYTAPSGDVISAGPANATSGDTAAFSVTAGATSTIGAVTFAPAPVTVTTGTVTGSAVLASGSSSAALSGVTVTLLTSAGSTVATTTTNASGVYSFTSVAAGSYEVQYTAPSGDIISAGPANATSGDTAAFSVTAGATSTIGAVTFAPAPVTVATGSITGSTVLDNGSSTSALGGVTVTLLTSAGSTVATTTTNTSGAFAFTGLAAGYYEVQYTTPSGDVIESGPADATTGDTIAFGVTAGGTRTMGPVTFTPAPVTVATGSITGSTVLDNGSSTSALGGVTVTLLTSAGSTVATTTTNTSGAFAFTGLAAGYYQVQYTTPSGDIIESGPADATTGDTIAFGVTAGGTRTMGPVTFASAPVTAATGSVTGSTVLGGAALANVVVYLMDASGTTKLATATTNSYGIYGFNGVAAGYYHVDYITPSGDTIQSGPISTSTGQTVAFGVTAGATRTMGPVTYAPTTTTQTASAAVVPAAASTTTSSSFTLVGDDATATRGDGNYVVTGTVNDATLTLGNGNQSVTLTGANDSVIVGQGTSTISVTGGHAMIHTDGGADTISVTAGGNLLDAGPGMTFLNTDGTGDDTFLLNASGQGLATITGYHVGEGNTLDLARAVAGLNVNSDLSNIGNFITSDVSGGNTTLYVTPTGGGSPYAFAQLQGTATSVAQLLTHHELSIT